MNRHYLCIGRLTLEQYKTLDSEKTHFVAGIAREALKLASQGERVHLVSRVGHDLLGDFALATLREAKINTTFVQRLFNCISNHRQINGARNGASAHEIEHQSPECELTVDDVVAAQALFIDAAAVVIDNRLAPEVVRTALELAEKYGIEVRYADAAEPEMLPNYLGRAPMLELSLN